MVARLRNRSRLTDPRVAAVLGRVPRHVFVPGVDLLEAYADQAIVTRYWDGWPVSSASQPAMVAAMLEQLRLPEGGSVLEIGAGTGVAGARPSRRVPPGGGVTRRASPCLPGPPGLAALDFSGPGLSEPDLSGPDLGAPGSGTRAGTGGDPARGPTLQLTVRGHGEARQQQVRLRELIVAWDAAGRPGPDDLRIDAYPSGVPSPDGGAIVHVAPHATFLISSSRP